MRSRTWLAQTPALGGLVSLVVALWGSGGQPSGITGVWSLDVARSALWAGGATDIVMSVSEQKETVTVAIKSDGREHRYRCSVDGAECKEATAHGDVYVRKVQRTKDGLTWSVTMTRKADGLSMSYTERWMLGEQGLMLTVHTTYPGGREVVKVFTRKPETKAGSSKH
jgi:hypothetical protein